MTIRVKTLGLACGTLCLSAASAYAGPMTESQVQNFSFPLSPGNAVLPFNQFDDQGGTRILEKVIFQVEGMITATVTAENDDPDLAAPDFALNMSGFMNVQFSTLNAVFGFDETFLTDGSVTASDGIDGSGTDFWNFGTVSDTGSGMDMVELPSDLSGFIGGGIINANVGASGGFSVQGSTNSTIVVSNFMGSGTVEVIYQFSVIPAPAGFAVFGLLAMGRRRRRC